MLVFPNHFMSSHLLIKLLGWCAHNIKLNRDLFCDSPISMIFFFNFFFIDDNVRQPSFFSPSLYPFSPFILPTRNEKNYWIFLPLLVNQGRENYSTDKCKQHIKKTQLAIVKKIGKSLSLGFKCTGTFFRVCRNAEIWQKKVIENKLNFRYRRMNETKNVEVGKMCSFALPEQSRRNEKKWSKWD